MDLARMGRAWHKGGRFPSKQKDSERRKRVRRLKEGVGVESGLSAAEREVCPALLSAQRWREQYITQAIQRKRMIGGTRVVGEREKNRERSKFGVVVDLAGGQKRK